MLTAVSRATCAERYIEVFNGCQHKNRSTAHTHITVPRLTITTAGLSSGFLVELLNQNSFTVAGRLSKGCGSDRIGHKAAPEAGFDSGYGVHHSEHHKKLRRRLVRSQSGLASTLHIPTLFDRLGRAGQASYLPATGVSLSCTSASNHWSIPDLPLSQRRGSFLWIVRRA